MDGKVIQFKAGKGFDVRRISKKEQRLCAHPAVVVDEEHRHIECAECGIIMDPYDYLLKVAYGENAAFDRYQLLSTEVGKMEKRYRNLNAEIERLKKVRNSLK